MSETVRVLEMAHSPFCIPITRALEASGVTVEREEIPNWDRTRVAEVTGGAYYEVPVLIHGEKVVYESGADSQDVARYVDATFAENRLFPESAAGLQEIVIEYLENEVELVTFKLVDIEYCKQITPVQRALVVRHKERKFGKGCVDDWEANRAQLVAEARGHLTRFEQMLASKPFLFGEEPIYADFLLFGVLGNYTFKGWNQIPSDLERLTAWHERLEALTF